MKKLLGILLVLVFAFGCLSGTAAIADAQSAVFYDAHTALKTATIPDSGSIKVHIDFTAPQTGSAKVIAAQYLNSKTLSDAAILATFNLTEGSPVSYTSEAFLASDAETVKVFVWYGESAVVPLLRVPAVIQRQGAENAVSKFKKAINAPDAIVINTPVKLGDIFNACSGMENAINGRNVQVFGDDGVAYTPDSSDWENGTLVFSKTGDISLTITDYNFCVPTVITLNVKEPDPVEKFAVKADANVTYTKGDIVKLGDLFAAVDGAQIDDAKVIVTSESVDATITYISDSENWANGTVALNGVGEVILAITDNNYCISTKVSLNVVYKETIKFAKADTALETYTLGDVVTLADLFTAIEDVEPAINADAIKVTATNATYSANADWTSATVAFDKVGEVSVEITDGYYCIPTVITLNVKEPEPVDKFTVKFPNTDTYLYRVGNTGDVALGTLFSAIEGAQIGNVTVTITSLDPETDASGTPDYKSDWTKSTINFDGAGPVEVTIDDDKYANAVTLKLEVIDATNTTKAASATSSNIVLLNDISGSFVVSGGYTFYGNGFTVNTGNVYLAAGKGSGFKGIITLDGGNLDNVRIVGSVYPVANVYQSQAESGENTYYFYNTVIINSGSCKITNSYISGSRAAMCVKAGDDVVLENTTLSGGSYANLEVRGGKSVTLKNVTTVQKEVPNSYGVTDNSGNIKNMIGMGIAISSDSVQLNIEGTFNQYNWVNQEQWNAMVPSGYSGAFPKLFSDSKFEANRHYRDGESVPYVNTGILSLVNWNNGANIIDNRTDKTISYTKTNVSLGGTNGGVYTVANMGTLTDALYNAPKYISDNYVAVAPKATFDYTTLNNQPSDGTSNVYCYYDSTSKKYMISFDEGDSRVWDGKILTITKGNKTLNYTMSVSGGLSVASDNTITFEDAGEYTVIYTYTDEDNYRLVNGQIEKYPVTYTKTVNIEVFEIEATALPTTFDFKSNGYRTETANGLVYAMPNVSVTSGSKSDGIAKTTIGGVDIFYPVISMRKTGTTSWYNYFSVFEAVTINDCDQTTVYNKSTTSVPSGLEVIGGFIINASGTAGAESANGTAIFNYSTGKEIKTMTYSTYGVGYYPNSSFTSGTNSRDEQTIVAKYRYTDSNGAQYYYYVGYWCEKHTKGGGCVTGDTLVTLSDGSQKRIDKLTYSDELLVWNFYEGKMDIAPSAIIFRHEEKENDIIKLKFSDNTELKVVELHQLFDETENKFVTITASNAHEYIGHKFARVSGDTYSFVELTDVEMSKEYCVAYGAISAYHYNIFTNNMITTDFLIEDYNLFNYFEFGENMKYDSVKMHEDIDTYGLYTFDDFKDYITYEEFVAFNCPYLKIAVGKGYYTYEEILEKIELWGVGYTDNENPDVLPRL